MFNKKNDPVADSVKAVMSQNQAHRDATKKVNEHYGVHQKSHLPKNMHAEYDAAVKKALNESEEGEEKPLPPLYSIARGIQKNWKNVHYAAKPYLDAMRTIKDVHDNYGHDSGHSIVAYALSNMNSYHSKSVHDSDLAKEHKAQLKAHLKAKPGTVKEEALDESNHGYSKSAVDKQISKDKRIKGKEAKLIHALLKGRQKSDEPEQVKEDEQLDEISDKKLTAYVSKAEKDNPKGKPRDVVRKNFNRGKGIYKAKERLGKTNLEEEQINEVGDTVKGKRTLARYITKAASRQTHDALKHATVGGDKAEFIRKSINKQMGIPRAADRLSYKPEELGLKKPKGDSKDNARAKKAFSHIMKEGLLSEISRAKLHAYGDAAAKSKEDAENEFPKDDAHRKAIARTIEKREKGMRSAAGKDYGYMTTKVKATGKAIPNAKYDPDADRDPSEKYNPADEHDYHYKESVEAIKEEISINLLKNLIEAFDNGTEEKYVASLTEEQLELITLDERLGAVAANALADRQKAAAQKTVPAPAPTTPTPQQKATAIINNVPVKPTPTIAQTPPPKAMQPTPTVAPVKPEAQAAPKPAAPKPAMNRPIKPLAPKRPKPAMTTANDDFMTNLMREDPETPLRESLEAVIRAKFLK